MGFIPLIIFDIVKIKIISEAVGVAQVTFKNIATNAAETEKKVYINNGNCRDTDGSYFELLDTPKFEDADDYV